MKKVVWKQDGSNGPVITNIGCVVMYCFTSASPSGKYRYSAVIYMDILNISRSGPTRNKLSDAKADCFRIVREILLDYKKGLSIELENFDITDDD